MKINDRAKERRKDKRIVQVGLGKKKVSDALIEEATEEAFSWLERGGVRRLWGAIKYFALISAMLIAVAVFYIFGN